MSAIQEFARTFAWDYRKVLLPLTFGAAGAIEIAKFCYRTYQDPWALKNQLLELKQKVQKAILKESNENYKEYHKKIRGKVFKVATFIFTATVVEAPIFIKLPLQLAIPASIIALAGVAKTFSTIRAMPGKIIHAKNYLQDAFKRRPNEIETTFIQRRFEAIKHCLKYGSVALLTLGLLGTGSYAAILLTKATSVWAAYDVLPTQTPPMVFAEYATLSLIHSLLARLDFKNNNKLGCLMHVLAAIAGVAFPVGYVLTEQELRIHHSWLGLLYQLFPWTALKAFGLGVEGDALAYFVSKERGYTFNAEFHSYDIENTVVDNLSAVIQTLTYLCIFESFSNYIYKSKQEEALVDDMDLEMQELIANPELHS